MRGVTDLEGVDFLVVPTDLLPLLDLEIVLFLSYIVPAEVGNFCPLFILVLEVGLEELELSVDCRLGAVNVDPATVLLVLVLTPPVGTAASGLLPSLSLGK